MPGAIAENQSVRAVHEGLSTELTPQKLAPAEMEWVSWKKRIFLRGPKSIGTDSSRRPAQDNSHI
jgi:hypothetical protein